MRGTPIDLPVPVKGQVNNVPPHNVGLDSLIDGQNCFVDIDGLFKVRFGYQPYLNNPGLGPIIGLAWWQDIDGSNRYIAATPTDIAAVVAGGWQKITGATPLTGSINDPVRIRPYFQNNLINMVICNNHDVLKVWNSSLATIQNLTPTLAATGTNVYSASTTPTFTAYPANTQFFFTFANTNTGNVTLGLNGLAPQPVMMLSNGALVQLPANFLQPGTIYNLSFDGTEFVIGTNLQAPIARDFCVLAGRILAINIPTSGKRNVTQATWTAAFDFQNWPALAFQNLVDTDDTLVSIQPIGNFSAIIYGRQSAWLVQARPGALDPGAFQFTPIQVVQIGPTSNLGVVVAEGLHYYLGIDGSVWMCDGSTAYHISQAIDPSILNDVDFTQATEIHGVYYAYYRQIWWFFPSRSNGLPGPSKAVVFSLERNVFEPVQTFTEPIRASTPQGQATSITCDQIRVSCFVLQIPCSTYGVQNQVTVFIGTDKGVIHNFNNNAPNDNGNSIPYFAVPGLLSAGAGQDLLLDSLDLFFNPAGGFEMCEMDFFNLPFPFANPNAPYLIFPFDLADPSTYQLPKILPTQNQYSRFIKMKIQGSSFNRAFAFGGGTVFVQRQDRGSKNLNAATGV